MTFRLKLTKILLGCWVFLISIYASVLDAETFKSNGDKELFKYFTSQCSSFEIYPNAFPDFYMGRKLLNACDISSAFEPEEYNFNYHFLKIANFKTTSVVKEYDIAQEIFANHYGWDNTLETSKLDRALRGDVIAYYELVGDKSLSPLFGEGGTNGKVVAKLSEFFDPIVTELMFLNKQDFNRSLSPERIMSYAEHLIRTSPHISIEQLLHSTWRLNDALYYLYARDNLSTASALALKIPHRLRLKVLALSSISRGFDAELINSIRLIEYNAEEFFGHFAIGVDENFYTASTKFYDEYFVKCSRSLVVAMEGGLAVDSPIDAIQCLQQLFKIDANLFLNYASLSQTELLTIAVKIDLENYEVWLESGSADVEVRRFFERIFIAELRHLSTSIDPGRRGVASELSAMRPDLSKKVDIFDSKLLSLAFNLELRERENKIVDPLWVKNEMQSLLQEENVCLNISQVVCHQNIRYVLHAISAFGFSNGLNYSLSTNVDSMINTLQQDVGAGASLELFTCTIEDWKKRFLQLGYEAGAFDTGVLRFCNSTDLLSLVSPNKGQVSLQEILINTGSFPKSPAIDYLTNHNLWNLEALGLLFLHFHQSTPVEEAIQLPDNGVGMYAKSLPTYQWLLSSSDIEKLFFKEFSFNYWNEVKPMNSVANFLLSKGKYELAYLAQRKFVMKQLAENDAIFSDITFPISLVRLKYLAQKAAIPDKFISEEVNKFFHTFNTSINANIFSVLEDAESSAFNLERNAQDVISIQLTFLESYLSKSGDDNIALILSDLFEMTDAQLMKACDTSSQMNEALQFAEDFLRIDNDLLIRIGVDEVLTYEFYRYLSICAMGRSELVDFDGLIINYILPNLASGGDLFDPNFLPIIMLMSDRSIKANSVLGAYTSLVFSKHYFGDLAEIFVSGNSNTLRTNQGAFEQIHTNIAHTFKSFNKEQYPQVNSERMAYQLHKLSLAFHFPILSYKTMDRFIDDFTTIYKVSDGKVVADIELYDQLKKHYKDIDIDVAAAKNPQQLAIAKAAYSSTEITISPNVLSIGDDFEQFFVNNRPEIKDIFANILASNDAIFVQTVDSNFGFSWEIFELDGSLLNRLKNDFSTGEAERSTFDDACNAFKPLRQYLEFIQKNNKNSEFVISTPSVNLFPIPLNIIAGNFCDDLGTIVLATGDVSGSIELARKLSEMPAPEYFVGLGNPMLKQRSGLQINLSGIGVLRGAADAAEQNLNSLPALPDAINEIIEISTLFDKSTLFLNEQASVSDALRMAEELHLKDQRALINLATHAFAVDYAGDIDLPGMLTVMNDELGVITANEIGVYNLKDAIVLLSACNTASGSIDRLDLYLSGFVEGFANAGADLISASLWPVKSRTAKEHSVDFINGFRNGNLSEALKNADAGAGSIDRAPFIFVYP